MLFQRSRVVLAGMALLLVAVVAGGSLFVAFNGRTTAPGSSQSAGPSSACGTAGPSVAGASSACGTAGPSALPTAANPPSITPTGSMSVAREGATATLLSDGRVLFAGGRGDSAFLPSAELYDPHTGKFSPTGSMTEPRAWGAAVLLHDGRVLMVGGNGLSRLGGLTFETYDPVTGKFTAVGPQRRPDPTCPPGGNCATVFLPPRDGLTATVLLDGKVLIAGGRDDQTADSSSAEADIFDPATGELSAVTTMTRGRQGHSAVLLPGGKVLILGGTPDAGDSVAEPIAEVYDPATQQFTATGSMSVSRRDPAVCLLPDGKVLVAGGYKWNGTDGIALASAEVYDPAAGLFRQTASMATARYGAPGTLADGGQALVVGGTTGSEPLASFEAYDYSIRTFKPAGSMSVPREKPYVVTLQDWSVLIAGGFGPGTTLLTSAEVWHPWRIYAAAR